MMLDSYWSFFFLPPFLPPSLPPYLVRPRHEGQPIHVVELLRNVLPERIARATRLGGW